MRKALAVALMAIVVVGVAGVATAATPELRPFIGAFIPTGDQRDILEDAVFMGGQGAVEMSESVHFVGSLAWAPRPTSKDVSIVQYDVGVETFRPIALSGNWDMRPFVGAGLGGRTYSDGANNDHKETNFLGYGALGTEFQLDRLAIRLEGRDTMTRFKGLAGDESAKLRNDISIVSGLSIHW